MWAVKSYSSYHTGQYLNHEENCATESEVHRKRDSLLLVLRALLCVSFLYNFEIVGALMAPYKNVRLFRICFMPYMAPVVTRSIGFAHFGHIHGIKNLI